MPSITARKSVPKIIRLLLRVSLLFFPCISVVFLSASTSQAETRDAITLTSHQQFDFADSLYKHKNYLSAEIEFNKFVFLFPQDDLVEHARFKIGLCLYYQKKYENALQQFAGLAEPFETSQTGIESGLFLSRCHLALNDMDSAIKSLHDLVQRTDRPEYLQQIYYQLAWTYIERGDFQNAYVYFEKIHLCGQTDYPIASIVSATGEASSIPSKSPCLAGFLSVIPGGGYAYCGRYNDALISLVINAACAAAAYESFDNNLNVLGGIFTAVGIGFYGGNIYGGVSSAHKYNRDEKSAFINQLKNQFNFDLMTEVDSDGISVKIQRRF